MTLALAKAILESAPDYSNLSQKSVEYMQSIGRNYPDCGYGIAFSEWVFSDDPHSYNSFGNGAAMRVSAAGFAAGSLEESKLLSRKMTEVTHNHPEGLKGAEATAVAIYMARTGSSILEIRDYIEQHYYPLSFTLDGIRPTYRFNETCQDTVPQALMAFFESTSFEDAIRNAISIGGDSDTKTYLQSIGCFAAVLHLCDSLVYPKANTDSSGHLCLPGYFSNSVLCAFLCVCQKACGPHYDSSHRRIT